MNGIWSVAPDNILHSGIKHRQSKPLLRKKKAWLIAAVSAVFVFVIAAIVQTATIDWQVIHDERAAADYIPSTEIANITDSLKLTRKGKAVFYATRPQLQRDYLFNQGCGTLSSKEAYTLGCYYRDDKNVEHIDLYDTNVSSVVDDNIYYDFQIRRNITALHEMLHAAYDRISLDERVDICYDLKSIVKHFPELEDILKLYTDDKYCTEAFARIGSEYIVELNDKSSTQSIAAADESDSIARLSEIYDDYFIFDQSLYDAHWANENRLNIFIVRYNSITSMLENEHTRTTNLINTYNRNPTWSNYHRAQNAVSNYNNLINEYRPVYDSYNKIMSILDSSSSASI